MSILLTGCMPKMTLEDMKAMMPQRPAELDRLNAFAGRWDTTGEMKFSFLDEVIESTGSNEAKWEGNGWYLVNRGTFGMGELGEMEAIETWTYDSHSKVYRTLWVDSMGTVATGTARYDEKSNRWQMKATGHGPFGKSYMKGTVTFPDDNTMEWTWSEYMFGGLIKTSEMTGTSRRR